MRIARFLLDLGGGIFVLLGSLHALYTFLDIRRPRRLVPQDPAVALAMKGSPQHRGHSFWCALHLRRRPAWHCDHTRLGPTSPGGDFPYLSRPKRSILVSHSDGGNRRCFGMPVGSVADVRYGWRLTNRFEQSPGRVFGEQKGRESMIGINQLRLSVAQPRVAQPHL